MRVAGGGAMVAFEGPQRPETWKSFYDRWFARHNWRAAGQWRNYGSAWYLRFVDPTPSEASSVDVHLGENGRGNMTGLLIVTPSPQGGRRPQPNGNQPAETTDP